MNRNYVSGSSGFVELRYPAVGLFSDGSLERAMIYADIAAACSTAERLAGELR